MMLKPLALNAEKVISQLRTGGLRYITPASRVGTAEQLGLKLEQLADDTVQISNKSPLGEFMRYMKEIEREGKGFKPTFENPESPFAQYYKYEQERTLEYRLKFEISLKKYIDFLFDGEFIYKGTDLEKKMERAIPNITPNEYWQVVDKHCKDVAKEVKENPNGLRPEFVDNAEKIHKWAEIFRTQSHYQGFEHGQFVEFDQYSKYYDEKMYNQAVEEFVNFVEKITGKKLLIGCKSRLNFALSSLSVLNNPNTYKDFDYILMSHGNYHALAWRFADNNKSVWEFIEQNVPRGKKVLAFCCEESGYHHTAHYDLSGTEMKALGNNVSLCAYPEYQPVKICESGIRHIIGHVSSDGGKGTPLSDISVNRDGRTYYIRAVNNTKTVYYNLDFSKYRTENFV